MTSYVDVDTSEEALQEDVELIEAVEQMVAKGAEAIITDVKKDVSGVYEQVKQFFDRVFPFVVYWREDHSLFWIDMQHLAIATVLFTIYFLFLTPWQGSKEYKYQKKLQRQEQNVKNGFLRQTSSYERLMQFDFRKFNVFNCKRSRISSHLERSKSTSSIYHGTFNNNNNSVVRHNETDDAEEEESEEQKFAKRWPTILETRYRCLVLPPECKRVEKPKTKSSKSNRTTSLTSSTGTKCKDPQEGQESTTKSEGGKEKSLASTDDNPYNRLVNYMMHLFHLIMLFRRYDYAAAGWTLIHWIQAAIRARSRQGPPAATEEDDEDDESLASNSMLSSSTDNEDSLSRASKVTSSQTTVGSGRNGAGTPVTANRSKASPRAVRSKKERMSMIEVNAPPVMPSIQDEGSASETDEISSINTDHRQHNSDESDTHSRDSTINTCSTPTASRSPLFSLFRERKRAMSLGEPEEKKETASYGDYRILQTPPRGSKATETFHTPLRDSQFPMLDMTATPLVTPIPSLQTPTITPSKASSISTSRPSSNSAAVKSRDALENYRMSNSLGRSGQNSSATSGALVSSSFSGPAIPHVKRLINREESTGNQSYYFETVDNKESLRRMVVEVPVPDRNGYIVGDEFLPDNTFTPLLVFVNSRSGPQQGHLLITQLRGLLNPIQIWDLADGGPEDILESFSVFTRLRILVCGGDGTVSWIVSTIEKMELQRWPPIAILPLGTGNDLARIHGWGGGYNNESLIKILEQVGEAYISWLDRWEMTIENKKGKVKHIKSFFNYLGVGADAQAALQVHMLRESRPQLFFSRLVNKAWYGVFGAEDIIKATSINLPHDIVLIADGVEVPLPADSQGIILLNIDSYAGGVPLWSLGHKGDETGNDGGGFKPIKRSRSLDTLKGMKVPETVSASTQTIGAGGRNPVPRMSLSSSTFDRVDSVEDIASLALTEEEKYTRVTACDRPSSCQDGLLDIVSIRGAFHLGQIRVGLSTAQKLCQCREATIIVKRKVSVQIDGEPWRQNICTLKVRRKKDAAIMLHRSADESNGVETEMAKLLDWAEERQMIDSKVHDALMKEFSRRIESKTRQRRVRNNDNLMFSLKRAMNSGNNLNNQNFNANPGVGNPSGIIF